jgi:nitrate reductase cytochrome c-type subunit
MIKILLIILPLFVFAQISHKYMTADNCKGCHKWVVDGWRTSWHSRSHYTKDPLYKATLEFIAQKRYKPVKAVELKCAQCHNPRIEIKGMDIEDIYAHGFGMESEKVKKALNTLFVKDGINCIVCHNVDKIKESKNPEDRGYKSVVWGPNNVMVGPYKDAISPYHKTKMAEHFLKANKLCFLCHYNGKNDYGILVYETGIEYEMSKSEKSCVECHMGKTRKQRVATVKVNGKLPPARTVRDHLFMGARNGNILEEALDISTKRAGRDITVTLHNLTPHRVPTGFASRALVVEADFSNSKQIKELTTSYIDEKGEKSIPYLGVKKVSDQRLMPNETKIIKFKAPKDAKKAVIRVYYKLLNSEVEKLLKIKDPVFRKKYVFYEEKFNL